MLLLYLSMLENEEDKKRMADIYEEHKHALLLYALKITGYNQTMAEDAVHNAFLSIIKEKEKYLHLDSKNFRYVSVSIVRNKCIDLLRKEKRYADTPIEELEIYFSTEEKSPEEQAEIASEYDLIKKHLSSIDEISRQVLIMKYALGMSYKEISEKLNIPYENIGVRISRAKDKVRRLVEKDISNNKPHNE
ncbi:MAG TPA: sigma-70 family RNA polymerase sigma factor [Mobilitalea sp.]|nr:sigma-70 family RNA polymerase sigma factor [Mobilitalea sp.]